MTESHYSLSNMLKLPTSTTSKPISTSCSIRNQNVNLSYSNFIPIGYGTFGTVYKAKCDQTGETVAIKKVFQDIRYKNRELQILQELNQVNVVRIKNYFYTIGKNDNEKYLNVVMDYLPESLYQIIKYSNNAHNKTFLSYDEIKLYSYQMFHALYYLESIGICHRDIKPQNILLNTTTKVLQFCDFGSAKRLKKDEPNVSYICSRYYRAPELIFNAVNYSNAIDVWSVGCVIAEMILGYPLFQGDSSIEQLSEIIKVLGTPSRDEITSMNPHYTQYKFPLIKCYTLREVFHRHAYLGEDFFDLMLRILIYEPNKRIKPLDALAHPFFDSIREKGKYNKDLYKVLFYFSQEEINNDKCGIIEQQLIPKWYKDIRHHGDYDSD